jgi:hypothetical protein
MPCTPTSDNASRTSSSLNGLMIAVTSFMLTLLFDGQTCLVKERMSAEIAYPYSCF